MRVSAAVAACCRERVGGSALGVSASRRVRYDSFRLRTYSMIGVDGSFSVGISQVQETVRYSSSSSIIIGQEPFKKSFSLP
jgi:hypothetical protein